MKRKGNLKEAILETNNLLLAYWKASKGKQTRNEVIAFRTNLEAEILALKAKLAAEKYLPGNYRKFEIYEPKKRTISAAPFKDRVVHHAIINICEPIFEKHFIFHTYACRKEKGTSKALLAAQVFAKTNKYYLKLDIAKYFDSIDHSILHGLLERLFKDNWLLHLFQVITKSYAVNPGCGLPIGNLTSQYFANYYLSGFDHFVLEKLRPNGYLRYMDDMLVFSNSENELEKMKLAIQEYLHTHLTLQLKTAKLGLTSFGMPWLGYRVFAGYTKLLPKSRKRFTKKLLHYHQAFTIGELSEEDYAIRLRAVLRFAEVAKTWHLRRQILNRYSGNWIDKR